MASARRVLCIGLLAVLGLFQLPAVAAGPADELMKRLPDDVIGFLATDGSDALKSDFEKTALGKLWNDAGVRGFYQAIKTELLAKLQEEAKDPNALRQVDMVQQYARQIISRPLVVGAAQVQVKEGPPLCVFAILDAGDRKAELAAAFGKLEAMAGPDAMAEKQFGSLTMRTAKESEEFPVYWGWAGNYFVLAGNDALGVVTKYLTAPRAAVPPYLDKLPAQNDAFVAYGDCQRISRTVSALIREEGGAKDMNTFLAVLKALGLDQVRTAAARVGFAGPDVVSHAQVEMPTPPTGLLAACKPVDPAWFGAVDARAFLAIAVNLETTSVYDTIMNVLKTASPDDGYPNAQKALGTFETEAKLRLRDGLLASLAGPIVFYSLPAGALDEAPRGGGVVILKLKDAQLFEKTLTALGAFASSRSNESLQISRRTRDDGRTVNIWAIKAMSMAGVMPTWSVASEHAVIGSTVELCDLGAKLLMSKGGETKSLLDTERYKKVAVNLPANPVLLEYTDSQVQLNQIVMELQQLWPMFVMVAMQANVKLPVMLPSLTEATRDMGPSFRSTYFGPDGLHSDYRGSGVEVSYAAAGGAALGMGILMPALARTRQLAFRMTSGTNLSGIGKAILIYANDHDDKLPPDLETLVKEVELSPQSLESKLKPKDFPGPSYAYIAGQTVAMYPGNIVAYEDPAYCVDGVNVLFLDSHVEFMKPEAFRRELEETCRRLGRPVPEVRFKGEKEVRPTPPKPAGGPQASRRPAALYVLGPNA